MKYYLLGIKGAGMSALGLILSDLGYNVVGYDDDTNHEFTEDKLLERGIKIYSGPNDEMDKNTIVIRSTAVKDDHSEIIKAKELELPIIEYYEMLGKLTKNYNTIRNKNTYICKKYCTENIFIVNYRSGKSQ